MRYRVLGVRDSSKTYEKVVSHEVVPESDLNVRQISYKPVSIRVAIE